MILSRTALLAFGLSLMAISAKAFDACPKLCQQRYFLCVDQGEMSNSACQRMAGHCHHGCGSASDAAPTPHAPGVTQAPAIASNAPIAPIQQQTVAPPAPISDGNSPIRLTPPPADNSRMPALPTPQQASQDNSSQASLPQPAQASAPLPERKVATPPQLGTPIQPPTSYPPPRGVGVKSIP